jgi:hypothetical protein
VFRKRARKIPVEKKRKEKKEKSILSCISKPRVL